MDSQSAGGSARQGKRRPEPEQTMIPLETASTEAQPRRVQLLVEADGGSRQRPWNSIPACNGVSGQISTGAGYRCSIRSMVF